MKPCSLTCLYLPVIYWLITDVEAAFQLRTHGHLFSSNRYTLVKTTERWEEQLSASTPEQADISCPNTRSCGCTVFMRIFMPSKQQGAKIKRTNFSL